MQEMQEMQNDVSVGTRLQLTSGLFGTVVDADNSDYIDVEIATEWSPAGTGWRSCALCRPRTPPNLPGCGIDLLPRRSR